MINIEPLTERQLDRIAASIPKSVARKHIRDIAAQVIAELDYSELDWPNGPIRITLQNGALLGRAHTLEYVNGVIIHHNAANTVLAIDLPDSPLAVESLT